MKELSNWGRWGPDNELGASNLITPERRRAATALVTEGIRVSLAHDIAQEEAVDAPTTLGPWPTSGDVAFIGHDMWNDVFPHEFSEAERLAAGSPGPGGARCGHLRQPRFRPRGRGGQAVEPLRVPVHGRAAAHRRRHGIAAQPVATF